MLTFKEILDTRFKGVISRHKHKESSGEVCALELLSVKKGIDFTDRPIFVRCFDFRPLNDMYTSDGLRTEWMLRMLEAYEDSLDWDREKQKKVLERIIISTVNQLFAGFRGLPESLVAKCKAAKTLEAVLLIAKVFNDDSLSLYLMAAAQGITEAARDVLSGNYEAAAYLASRTVVNITPSRYVDDIFTKACKIWLEAAKD